MFPKITSDIPPTSPLAAALAGQQTVDSIDTVGMTDLNHLGVLDLRGHDAQKTLKKIYPSPPKGIGDVETVTDGTLARLRHDHFVLLTENVEAAADNLMGQAGRVTLTDVTHGRAIIGLVGPNAPDVLPKVCGLDFATFPDRHAAQSSAAKVKTLIIRQDSQNMPTYLLIVDQSLAIYLWDVIFDAAQEFGGVTTNAR